MSMKAEIILFHM